MKKIKRIIAILMLFVILSSLSVCARRADFFTEEQHAKRISERLDKDPTTYNLYPLYNQEDKLTHFLVEMEPYGFTVIYVFDEKPKILSCIGAEVGMYGRSSSYGHENYRGIHPWSPYTIDETSNKPEPDNRIYKVDENGEIIKYRKSPYYVTGNIDEKKYLIRANEEFSGYNVCAIKKEGKFINLISGEEFDVNDKESLKKEAYLFFPHYHGNMLE